ncbi:MAG: DAK2 domain-containing protein [Bacilli bacterium]|nr:DAK2 domain-containing protein [Bacilli bacterium]
MKTINGNVLKQMVISGANNLYNCYPEIDALNVFPVPDGDTGTNMNLTISSGAKEVANRNDEDVYAIAKAFSKGLLMGARGNSGVILSQIFRGFAKSLEDKKVIGPVELADAFFAGSQTAYKAVMRPVEGTILTVIRESATLIHEQVTASTSIETVFELLIKEAHASLKRTPDLLPVLKEVGVVDSGGAGLIKVLEGFQKAVLGEVVEKTVATVYSSENSDTDENLLYCIEFVLELGQGEEKQSFLEKKFTGVLESHGKLLECKVDANMVRVHVHTNLPGNIITYANKFGEFKVIKVENIKEGHTSLETKEGFEEKKEEAAPVEMKEYGLIAVGAGDGIEKIFKDLRVDYVVSGGQTMNPSTEDFIEAIRKVNAKQIFILPNNSNIIMAASQACEVCEGDVIAKVIPSKTIPQGLVACMMFNPEEQFDANFKEMSAALESVKTGQVTFSIKDTNIDGVDIKKDDFMGIVEKSIICCKPSKVDSAFEVVAKLLDDMTSIITIIVGEDVTEKEEKELLDRINDKLPVSDIDIDVHRGNQPVYNFIIGVE